MTARYELVDVDARPVATVWTGTLEQFASPDVNDGPLTEEQATELAEGYALIGGGASPLFLLRPTGRPLTFKRVKVISSHSGYARFLATLEDMATIPRQSSIPSPYAYSSEWETYLDSNGREVICRETSHRRYEVFEVQR